MRLEDKIILSAHRGFFGLISKEVRGITIDWDDDLKYLKLRVYIQSQAPQEICEDMDLAYTDIIADFDFNKVYDIECILTDDKISKLKEYRLWYFIRKEDNYSD